MTKELRLKKKIKIETIETPTVSLTENGRNRELDK
jgi:hypothetical protein